MRAPLDMLCPDVEVEKKDLPDMVRKLQEDYQETGGGQFCSALGDLWTRPWTLL